LDHLDGFIHEHALGFLLGHLSLAGFAGMVLSCGLRRKGGKTALHVRPGLFIHLPDRHHN